MKFITIILLALSFSIWADEIPRGYIGYTYPDTESRDFLIKVLESMNKKYKTQELDNGITIFWKPDNNSQEKEVSARVSQYNFVKEVCPNLPVPKPSEKSQTELSCAK